MRMWNATTGEEFQTFAGHACENLALSHDSKILSSVSDNGVRIWSVKTGRMLGHLVCLQGSDNWLFVTLDGQFKGSDEGFQLVTFRDAATLRLIDDEQYTQSRRREGLLAQVLQEEQKPPATTDNR